MTSFAILLMGVLLLLTIAKLAEWLLEGLAQLIEAALLIMRGVVKVAGTLLLIWLLASIVLRG